MKEFFVTLSGILFIGMAILLCLFSCVLATKSDEYWEELKRKKKKNERR